MTTRNHLLRGSLQGDDVETLIRRIVASRPEFQRAPVDVAANLGNTIKVSPTWLDDVLAQFERSIHVRWDGPRDPTWPLLSGKRLDGAVGTVKVNLRADWTVPCLVEAVLSTGAWRSVFDSLFVESETWKERSSFDSGHVDLGWGCMFVGEQGHEPLVSRRWLEFGPWWLRRFPGDVSLVQFHDLDADAETALTQANPGHKRMSDHDIGGWLRSSYRPGSTIPAKNIPEFKAVYVREDQSLRVVCAPGRVISQREMLDACAQRLVAKYNPEQPTRTLRYVFIDPADAEKHLHDLWLRDIEVWAIENGKEVRLDDRHHASPTLPAWVYSVQQRNDQ